MEEIKNWTEDQLNEWIQVSGWGSIPGIKLDESLNRQLFVQQNKANPEAWKAALDFFKRKDLNTLPSGRLDLPAKDTFVALSEYVTKEWEAAKYEAHRKYIDIQYVIEGGEYIEVLPLSAVTEEQKYDEQKDILFFEEKAEGIKLFADPAHLFIFFPEDVHKPSLKIKEGKTVKKAVVKIPVL